MVVAPNVLGNAYWFAIFTTVVINMLAGQQSAHDVPHRAHLARACRLHARGGLRVGPSQHARRLAFVAAIPAAALASALVALIVSFPFLRVAGIYFAILTLLAAETLRLVAYNWKGVTGGSTGLDRHPRPRAGAAADLGSVEFGRVITTTTSHSPSSWSVWSSSGCSSAAILVSSGVPSRTPNPRPVGGCPGHGLQDRQLRHRLLLRRIGRGPLRPCPAGAGRGGHLPFRSSHVHVPCGVSWWWAEKGRSSDLRWARPC